MTPESVRCLCKALSVVVVAVGGFGSLLCVPYALTSNLFVISAAGVYFVAGAIMIVGGLLSFSILNKA